MTNEEYGVYHRLLDNAWVSTPQCFLTNDEEVLAKLLRVSVKRLRELWKVVGKKFGERDSMIFNPRQVAERNKQRKRYLQTVKNGKLGGRPPKTRAVSERKPGGFPKNNHRGFRNLSPPETHGKPQGTETQEKPLSSSSSFSSPIKENTHLPPNGGGGLSVADLFEIFWAAYPRPAKRPKALAAFLRLRPDQATLHAMLEAIDQQKQSSEWTRESGRYIPHPENWLKNHQWEDTHSPVVESIEDKNARVMRELQEESRGKT